MFVGDLVAHDDLKHGVDVLNTLDYLDPEGELHCDMSRTTCQSQQPQSSVFISRADHCCAAGLL